jgi:hypothetical protein
MRRYLEATTIGHCLRDNARRSVLSLGWRGLCSGYMRVWALLVDTGAIGYVTQGLCWPYWGVSAAAAGVLRLQPVSCTSATRGWI